MLVGKSNQICFLTIQINRTNYCNYKSNYKPLKCNAHQSLRDESLPNHLQDTVCQHKNCARHCLIINIQFISIKIEITCFDYIL